MSNYHIGDKILVRRLAHSSSAWRPAVVDSVNLRGGLLVKLETGGLDAILSGDVPALVKPREEYFPQQGDRVEVYLGAEGWVRAVIEAVTAGCDLYVRYADGERSLVTRHVAPLAVRFYEPDQYDIPL